MFKGRLSTSSEAQRESVPSTAVGREISREDVDAQAMLTFSVQAKKCPQRPGRLGSEGSWSYSVLRAGRPTAAVTPFLMPPPGHGSHNCLFVPGAPCLGLQWVALYPIPLDLPFFSLLATGTRHNQGLSPFLFLWQVAWETRGFCDRLSSYLLPSLESLS